MITQADIAKRLGLSQAAVASVVGSYRGRRMLSPEWEARVRRMAEELGYRPHRQAQMLRGRKSGLIGILQMGERGIAFTTERVAAMEDAVREAGYETLTCDVRLIKNLRLVCEQMLDARVEGILMAVPPPDISLAEIDRLRKLKVPLASVSGRRLESVPQVVADVRTGMSGLAGHLIRSGRRRLVLLTVARNTTRIDGFRDALRAVGGCLVEADDVWPAGERVGGRMVLCPPPDLGQSHAVAAQAVRTILAWPEPPDALLCTNDDWALAALSVCGLADVEVPAALAVTGFDGTAMGAYYHPPLTTVAQPIREMARKAMEFLVRQIHGETIPARRMTETLPCQLTIRASCGAGAEIETHA